MNVINFGLVFDSDSLINLRRYKSFELTEIRDHSEVKRKMGNTFSA